MPFIVASVIADLTGLLEITAQIDAEVDVVVEATAGRIRDVAEATAAVDTGAMITALYVKTDTKSDYSDRVSVAEGLNPKGEILPELPAPGPRQALVGEAESYGVFQEYGTHKMPAHPYLTPAAEGERAPFLAAMKAILP